MINLLHIENIAVIEKSDIEFSPGLNVLTGETGAGKSIIIDSIGILMGAKTSREVIRHGSDYAIVSGTFDSEGLTDWLSENDIEDEGELVIRRKISADGKSSCRINGAPVSVGQLKEISTLLVDIHGQNDGRALLDEKTHLRYLDCFGNYSNSLNEYSEAYREYCDINKQIKACSMDEIEKVRLSDSLSYQIAELKAADIKEGEYDSAVARRDLLRNSEKLTELLDEALYLLSGQSDSNIYDMLRNAEYAINKASSFVQELESSAKSLHEAAFLVSDVNESISDIKDSLDFSTEEYNELEERISTISRLMRKYNKTDDELILYLSDCEKKLDEIQYSGELLEKLNKKLTMSIARCRRAAEKLTLARRETAAVLENRIKAELKDLNMPSVSFIVDFTPVCDSDGFNSDGDSSVCFKMSANAGEAPGRISKIASGGELSRIMLAMKNVFAENDPVPTMIFDEIDTGVSGIAGQKVAEKLYSVARKKQVMCVTHLPQIAAMADHHFCITKSEQEGRTFTRVEELDSEGRSRELARLYGGDNITDTTIISAKEQIYAAEQYKRSCTE